jgi:hypothetical protein
MLYAVSAKLIPNRGPEFHTRLTDGSIAAQRPDGAEIVAAMRRARGREIITIGRVTVSPRSRAMRSILPQPGY